MGKIIASVSITWDGILSGPSGDEENMISWAMPGVQETVMDNLAMFQKADAILMGRVTYEGFAGPLFIVLPENYNGPKEKLVMKSFKGYADWNLSMLSKDYVLYEARRRKSPS